MTLLVMVLLTRFIKQLSRELETKGVHVTQANYDVYTLLIFQTPIDESQRNDKLYFIVIQKIH